MSNTVNVNRTCDSDQWWTPLHILVGVKMFFAEALGGDPRIPLDPATDESTPTGAETFYSSKGEDEPWWDGTFVNPPYGKDIKKFTAKIKEETANGVLVVALLPATRGEQKYWQEEVYNDKLSSLCLVRKRLHFLKPDGEERGSAPFASTLFFYNAYWADVSKSFKDIGKCIEIGKVI